MIMGFYPNNATHSPHEIATISAATGLRCMGWLRVDKYTSVPILLNPARNHDECVSLCERLNQTESN